MATDYPIEIDDTTGGVRIAGLANFTDPDNQPASQAGPLVVPETGVTVLVTDTPDGDALLSYDADAGEFQLGSLLVDSLAVESAAGFFGNDPVSQPSGDIADALETLGLVDAPILGASTVYVTVQGSAPTTFVTPLVFDSTAVTGGLYAWDGSAYQQVGGPLA